MTDRNPTDTAIMHNAPEPVPDAEPERTATADLPALDVTRGYWITYRQTAKRRHIEVFDTLDAAEYHAEAESAKYESQVLVFGPQAMHFDPPTKATRVTFQDT